MIFQKAYFYKGCQGPLEIYHKVGGTKVGFTQEQSKTTEFFAMSLSYFKFYYATPELSSNITNPKEFVLQDCSYVIKVCACHDNVPQITGYPNARFLDFNPLQKNFMGSAIPNDTIFNC